MSCSCSAGMTHMLWWATPKLLRITAWLPCKRQLGLTVRHASVSRPSKLGMPVCFVSTC